MAAYGGAAGSGDSVGPGQGTTITLPNFVGEMFKLSPLDTPVLSLIGGLTGGQAIPQTQWTWQDTLHRTPAMQAGLEGADATFYAQKRNERKNVLAIHQYGVELSYTKQAAIGQLGGSGDSPTIGATSILGNQPVSDERAWQLQIKIEQAALDVEVMFLNGTYANPNNSDSAARQTQGIVGAVSSDTTTTYGASSDQAADRTVVNDIAQKMYDNGAKMYNVVIMVNSQCKLELGQAYQGSSGESAPRSYNVFGVNITDIETEFGRFPVVLNRHLDADTVMFIDLALLSPKFLPIPGKGHFFMEPLAKSGAYDRDQLYGEIGLQYGPAGWHGKAANLHDTG